MMASHTDLMLPVERRDIWLAQNKTNDWLYLQILRKMPGGTPIVIDAGRTNFPGWN